MTKPEAVEYLRRLARRLPMFRALLREIADTLDPANPYPLGEKQEPQK